MSIVKPSPDISVILPVYNAEKFIKIAVQSILDQTFINFELIIINDGSTDKTLDILSELALKDMRITLVTRENKGLICSLNEAISLAKANYIARMDADDISLPQRLAKQLAYLKKHPTTAVLGCGYRYMSEDGTLASKRHTFTQFEDIKASFLFGNPIAHPSVMVNKELLGDEFRYSFDHKTVEDLELWCRIAEKHPIENLKECLLHYRILNNSISGSNLIFQIESAAKILAKQSIFKSYSDGLNITQNTYSYTVNTTSYFQFLIACFKLNIKNIESKKIKPLNLLKRTLIALLLWRRKSLRN